MDEEIKQLAALAIRNAFYQQFSGLVNAYLQMSEGLIDDQLDLLSPLTSVYGRDTEAEIDDAFSLYIRTPKGHTSSHSSMLEALSDGRAVEIVLNGETVMRRGLTDGWRFVGEKES